MTVNVFRLIGPERFQRQQRLWWLRWLRSLTVEEQADYDQFNADIKALRLAEPST